MSIHTFVLNIFIFFKVLRHRFLVCLSFYWEAKFSFDIQGSNLRLKVRLVFEWTCSWNRQVKFWTLPFGSQNKENPISCSKLKRKSKQFTVQHIFLYLVRIQISYQLHTNYLMIIKFSVALWYTKHFQKAFLMLIFTIKSNVLQIQLILLLLH